MVCSNHLDDDWDLKKEEIRDIFLSIEKANPSDIKESASYLKNILSSYGMSDLDEFMAECIAEYFRETAKNVVEILMR